jgi:glycosyltransferase involved in cell wall biosynthesis
MIAPPLSVVMSVYNDERYVALAIDSILSQSFGDFEFLIIDDRSTDRSAEVIHDKAAADKRIRILDSPAKGRVPALNRLFDEVHASRTALMDSDDVCRPERFARQIAFLDANPDHGAVSCECDIIDANGLPLSRPKIVRPQSHQGILANLEDGPLLNHNAVMLATAAVRQVGGYRAIYRHAEDYDLWLRLSQVTRLANLPDCLVSYRVYDQQVSTRHVVEQTRNAAIAWMAHQRRLAGDPDPLAELTEMPAMATLDARFGPGSSAYVRRRIVDRVLYSAEALAGDGWPDLLGHIAETGGDPRLWRASLRLLRAGKPVHALRCAAALAGIGR